MERLEETKEELTIRVVANYLNSKHGIITSWEELKINLQTGINFNKIDYELAEKEFYKIRGIK